MVEIWDMFVRLFHWLIVVAFTTAFVTGEFSLKEFHIIVGYLIVSLISCRLLWGFIGTKAARFSDFVKSPFAIIRYLVQIVKNRPGHFLDHNPAGGAMVIMLLLILTILCISGLATLAVIEFDGPFWQLLSSLSDAQSFTLQLTHKIAAKVALVLVGLHLLGVLIACVQHRENLVKAMFTGKKRKPMENA